MAERPERPDVITLTFPSRLELLGLLDQVALSLSERLQFSDEERSAISLSVVEAGTNAIQHAHRKDASKPVDILFQVYPDRLEIDVHDQGPGFELGAVNGDVTSPEHIFDARGRGIFIMRACMDQVQFDFTDGGTTVRLTKLLHPDANGGRPRG